MQQLDHSSIYVLIAGTYTPLCAIAIPANGGEQMLITIWSATAIGVALTVVQRMPKIALAMYIIIGWLAVFIIPSALSNVGWLAISFYLVGGVIYTAGAIMFFMKWPKLVPHHFGFHEMWHVYTVIAAALHFVATAVVVTQ